MTDLEKFKELYKSIGIELIEQKKPDENQQFLLLSEDRFHGTQPRNYSFKGYSGFFSEIIFDMNGKFIEQGFWE